MPLSSRLPVARLLVPLLLCTLCSSTTAQDLPVTLQSPCTTNDYLRTQPICNPTLSNNARISNLISLLTLDEKIGMLGSDSPMAPRLGLNYYEWWNEALHGLALSPGSKWNSSVGFGSATSFPAVIGTASAFNRTLWKQIATTISTEARAFSNANMSGLNFFAPNINIFRDPRWGRGHETPGEDPYLTSEYTVRYVRGLQFGDEPAGLTDDKYLKTIACCKHYAAYDLEGPWKDHDRNSFNAVVSDRDMHESYLPPFEACVKLGEAHSVMCSYNAVNGIPACANKHLLDEILREQWDFDGWVTGDCNAVANIYEQHHYTDSEEAGVAVALQAGTDMDCGYAYPKYVKQAIEQKLVTELDVDRAINRTLTMFLTLGHFDDFTDQPYRQIGAEHVNTPYAQQLAYETAVQSIVLLEHGSLPLEPQQTNQPLKIAVTGPHADNRAILQSAYYGIAPFLITPCDAFAARSMLASCIPVVDTKLPLDDSIIQKNAENICNDNPDAVVFVGGLDMSIELEQTDRHDLWLPAVQVQLAHALRKACQKSVPIVLVLYGGGGIDYPSDGTFDGVLWAGYPGQSGGNAIADVILGQFNPSGRLPVTWYPSSYVDSNDMTDMSFRPTASNQGRTYRFYSPPADAPATEQLIARFGSGGSYTTWEVKAKEETLGSEVMHVSTQQLQSLADNPPTLTVTVTNSGRRAGTRSVLLYVTASAEQHPDAPLLELKGFEKVELQPGESTEVQFALTADHFRHVDEHGRKSIRVGVHKLMVDVAEGVTLEKQVVITHDAVTSPRLAIM